MDDSEDAGGETAFGITAAVARAAGYAGPLGALSRDQAKAIYRQRYWDAPGLGAVAALSSAVAAELFDTGVNMGTQTAARWLQRALNVLNRQGADFPDVPADGRIGRATIAALGAFLRRRGGAGKRCC